MNLSVVVWMQKGGRYHPYTREKAPGRLILNVDEEKEVATILKWQGIEPFGGNLPVYHDRNDFYKVSMET
jgi:hypothetical protein